MSSRRFPVKREPRKTRETPTPPPLTVPPPVEDPATWPPERYQAAVKAAQRAGLLMFLRADISTRAVFLSIGQPTVQETEDALAFGEFTANELERRVVEMKKGGQQA